MGIKRFFANKDATITNAFKPNLINRATGSNMGASDIMEIFSIYGQATTASAELSRALIQFPVMTDLSASRDNLDIPASGSVKFFLRLYNAEHAETLPSDFSLTVAAVSQSWTEGVGLDMETYLDIGPANWDTASTDVTWTTAGGDYLNGAGDVVKNPNFIVGTEDIELDITDITEQWLNNTVPHNGLGIYLSSSFEASSSSNLTGSARSYYTKKFFARDSEFFFKRPTIEARWDSSNKDDAGNFFLSSSLMPSESNLNSVYLYNVVGGQLRDIPGVGTGNITASCYNALSNNKDAITLPVGGDVVASGDVNVTGGWQATGIYSASFAFTGSSTLPVYIVWSDSSTQIQSSSAITVKSYSAGNYNPSVSYISNITGLKPVYSNDETARFRVFVRPHDWSPTVYSVSSTAIAATPIEKAYFKIHRVSDGLDVVAYGTGSATEHTRMSYDSQGNYFDFDMSMLEPDFQYGLKFMYQINGLLTEQKEVFKFRVE